MTTQTEALKIARRVLSNTRECDAVNQAIECIDKALAQQSNEQVEPVAWVWKYSDGDEEVTFLDPQFFSKEALGIASTIPLYTHPPVPTAQPEQEFPKLGCVNHDCDKCKSPQRKPLTDQQIVDLCDGTLTTWEQVRIARAIEAAHGIKE